VAGQIQPQNLGSIELAVFNNPEGLQATSDNLFMETGASGTPKVSTAGLDGFGTILQNHYEASNMDAVGGVTRLITTQRHFEMAVKAEKAAEEMLQTLNKVGS
jgi:flagellar basal-body rod protein FlgG